MQLLDLIEQLFSQYGYLVLLIGLPLDAIALPIPPGNTTLTYTGYLSYKGSLEWVPAMGAAFIGAVLGISITYWFGYQVGTPLVERYGKWLFLKPEHIEKTRKTYEKYGNKLLLISFFAPGIRQFIGYFVGVIRIPYRTFALYAYTGAGLWIISFFGIGYLFGEQWQAAFTTVEQYLKYLFISVIVIFAVYGLWKWRKNSREKQSKESD